MKTTKLIPILFVSLLLNPSIPRINANNDRIQNLSTKKDSVVSVLKIPAKNSKEEDFSYKKSSSKLSKIYLNTTIDYKKYAADKVTKAWDKTHVDSFFWIIQHESGWNPNAQNSKSTAYGIGQFLDSTWGIVGYKKTSDPYKQIDAMIKYVQLGYKNPKRAAQFKRKKGWY